MASYKIPEKFIVGFKELSKLNSEQVERLTTCLNSLSKGDSPKDIRNKIESSIDSIPSANKISSSIFSLGSILHFNEIENFDQLAHEISESVFDADNSKEETHKLFEILRLVLNNSYVIKNTFKAIAIITDNKALFRESKIYSDIRLVFNDDISDSNRTGVIINQLKIEYSINNDTEDFFISLDESDLISLKKEIDRALEKNRMIRNDYKDITFLNNVN